MEVFSLFLQLIYLVNRQTGNVRNQLIIQPFHFHFTGIGHTLFFTAFPAPFLAFRIDIAPQDDNIIQMAIISIQLRFGHPVQFQSLAGFMQTRSGGGIRNVTCVQVVNPLFERSLGYFVKVIHFQDIKLGI